LSDPVPEPGVRTQRQRRLRARAQVGNPALPRHRRADQAHEVTLARFFGQRLAATIPVLVSVVTLIFLVVRVLPGDPAQAALGENASSAAVADLRTRMGLDAPLPLQYVRFMGDLARGDLGVSLINGTPVREQIAYN